MYGPGWMCNDTNSHFKQINTTKFSLGLFENHEHVNTAIEDNGIYIGTGGNINQIAPRNQILE